MRRLCAFLPLITTALVLVVFASTASADTPTPIPASANWQTTVNFYRAMAGLPGVAENSSWSSGAYNHSCYMAENDVVTHSETPGNPCYSPEGHDAAQNGNVALYYGFPSVNCDDRRMVEVWIAGPYHAIGILDTRLATSGYGDYIGNAANPGTRCGATLDVLRGRTGPAPSGPVFFPGNGTTTPLLSYDGGESPDPLAACSGYTVPTGPPILLQLPTSPGAATVTLRDNGVGVPSCQVANDVTLSTRNAIAIMPRNPYTSGHAYSVDVQVNATTYSWSFYACAAGQTGGSCNGPTAVTLRAASAVRTRAGVIVRWRTASEADVLGFNVYRGAVKVNRAMIPSVFGGAASGHRYSWIDRAAPRSAAMLRYRLQAVHLNGTRSWLARATVR